MIPYIRVPDLVIGPFSLRGLGIPFSLGPITLHPFGLLVATGVVVGTALATERAKSRGVDLDKLNSFITWMLVAGFLGGHMLDEIFYHPEEFIQNKWSIFFLWQGLSSFGGFVGAIIGGVLWKYFEWRPLGKIGSFTFSWARRRPQAHPILPFADLILSVFPVAWIFGRSGCSVVHDHPGALATSDTFLAVAYGQGPSTRFPGANGPIEFIQGHAPRYDLGLLELMFTVILAACFALTWRKKLTTGSYIIAASLSYAPVRFAMDFLRITDGETADPRYAGLTPAQWCCLALFVYGLGMIGYIWSLKKRGIELFDSILAPPEADLSKESSGS